VIEAGERATRRTVRVKLGDFGFTREFDRGTYWKHTAVRQVTLHQNVGGEEVPGPGNLSFPLQAAALTLLRGGCVVSRCHTVLSCNRRTALR